MKTQDLYLVMTGFTGACLVFLFPVAPPFATVALFLLWHLRRNDELPASTRLLVVSLLVNVTGLLLLPAFALFECLT